MKVIGLTGGIASGKSTVSKYLASLGAEIIDADKIARDVVMPGEKAYTEIVKVFGNGVLLPDKTLDRKKLAQRVFGDVNYLKVLNSIVHPEVIRKTHELLEEAKAKGKKVAVIDAPLLIEADMTSLVDETWVVIVNPDIQLERAVERDKTNPEAIKARIASQMPQDEKIKYATRIINNSGTIEETFAQVKKYYSEISSE